MKVAVVGSGIAGLGAAWALGRAHDVTLYEAEPRLGGHAHTLEVEAEALGAGPGERRRIAVDTGFIVYNSRNYPNLVELFAALDVPTEASDMSFSASIGPGRFEYEGSARGLFLCGTNALNPRLWRMLRDTLRFYRQAPDLLDDPAVEQLSLGELLDRHGYSGPFVEDHLLPMGAAIWSTPVAEMLDFPARSFLRFCDNHGLLQLDGRPQWRTVTGGSRSYVDRLTRAFAGRIRAGRPVTAVRRTLVGVTIEDRAGPAEPFDQVVLACHADQALAMLGAGATPAERELLSAFRYLPNRAVLHQDAALMPRRRNAWASWNYLAEGGAGTERRHVSLTYWMNRLQSLDARVPLFVSLNPLREPDQNRVLAELSYRHPQFDRAALAAQTRLPAIQGRDRIWFCGSYCGYGFHEDGLQAGLTVAAALGAPAPWHGAIAPRSPAAATARPAQEAPLAAVPVAAE